MLWLLPPLPRPDEAAAEAGGFREAAGEAEVAVAPPQLLRARVGAMSEQGGVMAEVHAGSGGSAHAAPPPS